MDSAYIPVDYRTDVTAKGRGIIYDKPHIWQLLAKILAYYLARRKGRWG
jgi:hypothetical protein